MLLQVTSYYRKQIGLDLMRTMPTNINFNSTDAEGVCIHPASCQPFCC